MTITWKVENLERDADSGLVTVVHWRVGSQYGSTKIERGEEFVPFEELTQETIVGWVKEKLGAENVSALESVEEPTQSVSGTPESWTQPMPTTTE